MPRRKKRDPAAVSAGDTQGERQSIYFPREMAEEIKEEALRQDRSISWIIQKAWRIARPKMKQIPSASAHETEIVSWKRAR